MSDFNSILAAEGLTSDSVAASVRNSGLTKLTSDTAGKGQSGDYVLSGQVTAGSKGFSKVSHLWYDNTQSYEDGLKKLEEGRAQTVDIMANVTEMVPTVNANGEFCFLHRPTEKYFVPTPHAIRQAGNWADTGTWYVENMLTNPLAPNGKEKYARDRQDAETLAKVFQNGFRRLDTKKSFFWRTRTDGTLRAMLTDRYAVVDNRWFIEKLASLIPGGRLSHWRGDSDTIYGNILIPDTIREESDSDYGAMLSIGNSEIGERRVSSLPSIFRAICMNGCIHQQKKGKGIKQVHRGKVNLDTLFLEIKENLLIQIPLAKQGIDALLNTRTFAWDGAEARLVIASVAKDVKLGKKQASDVLSAYNVESKLTPDLGNTWFSVVNAITRAGQQQNNADWLKFDEIGGELSVYEQEDFKRVISRAKNLSVKEVDEAFA
jgi:hypothetical protein